MRTEGKPVVLVAAANTLFKREALPPDRVVPSRITAELILQSYRAMGCAALGVGAYDLSLGVGFLAGQDPKRSPPLLSANLLDPQGKPLFRPYLITDVGGVRVGIFSVVDAGLKRDKVPESDRFTLRDPFEAARDVVSDLRAAGAQLVVLLTDMEGRASRRLAMDLPIDLIVGSDRRNQISLPIRVHNTLIAHLDRGGRSIGRLDIAPADANGSSAAEAGSMVLGQFAVRNAFVQLRVDIPDDPALGPLVSRTLQELSKIQAEVAASPPPKEDEDCGKEYVGIAVCRRCHEDRYRGWSATRHARAYQTLVDQQRQFDGECVVCHAVAFSCDQDAIDWKALDRFVDVQCEACHGPGSEHARLKGKQELTVGAEMETACARCHTEERSADFNFAERFSHVCTAPQK